MPRRVLLDSSVYGKMLEARIEAAMAQRLEVLHEELHVYGMNLIRRELRETPLDSMVGARKLRLALLWLYDRITKGRGIIVSARAESLAKQYFAGYRKNGGAFGWREVRNDFMIVAQASLSRLDMVVSADARTMLSSKALLAYRAANKKAGLLPPNFISYDDFRRMLL